MSEPPRTANVRVAPVAGFWRRVAAFLVDGLILGLIGYALGLVLFDTFVRLGPWGRCVGFLVALAYFVPQESGRGGGQSLGKRLLRIRVVDAKGLAQTPARGAARFAVFGVPYFLNGAALPMNVATFAGGVPIAALGLGGLFALVYLLAFNRRTRQSLHDLALGTFVVRVPHGADDARAARDAPGPARTWRVHRVVAGAGDPRDPRDAPGPARTWRVHRVVAGAGVALAAASPLLFPQLFRLPLVASLRPLSARLAEQPELRAVNVFEFAGRVYGLDGVGDRRELLIQATIAQPLADNVPLSTRLAGLALASDPDAASEDLISVRLAHGYDIGIASSWTYQRLELRPEQWADRVRAGVAD